MVKMQSIFLS